MYELRGEIRSTCSEEGGVLLDLRHGQLFRLNPVGAMILASLQSGHSDGEMAKAIATTYGISEEVALGDVREFLASLAEHQLVRSRREERLP